MRPRLITIPLSHYCERARWALDHFGLDYDEEQHLQFFASRVVKKEGGRRTVPVLVAGPQRLFDSADIVRWAQAQAPALPPVYPRTDGSDVEALDQQLGGRYGVETRRLAYAYFFRCVDECLPYNMGAAPGLQVWLLELGRPLVQPKIERHLGTHPEAVQRGFDLVRTTFDEIAERLEDGRPYLCGEHFTAADLSFAAMTSVLVLPDRYPTPLPPLEALDDEARSMINELRGHRAGQYALHLYERRPRVRARLPRPLRIPART